MAAELGAGARAYQEIKQAILSGDLKQRQKLEIDELAKRWRVSATPVRHALAVLTAERLVVAHPARGYSVAFWGEAELAALYEWRWRLAEIALDTFQAADAASLVGLDHPQTLIAVLRRMQEGANAELRRAAVSADERLLGAYRVEPEILPQTDRELAALNETLDDGDAKRAHQRLKVFFRRRIADAALIRARASVKALPRNGV
jgi:DNA-binding FadR family transcriptional regulator